MIIKSKKRFGIFGEERFKIINSSTDKCKDPFKEPLPGKYYIDENTGGGIRGIISVLARLVNNRVSPNSWYNIKVNERWGTSTGGIIQASLCKGLTLEDLLSFYIEKGPIVFSESKGGILFYGAKYNSNELEIILNNIFSDITMKELYEQSHVKLYLVAYDVLNKKVVIFSHENGTANIPVKVAVRATMSAPFFFRPATYKQDIYWDGGVTGYNCSALMAYSHAINDLHLKADEIQILSVGTGYKITDEKEKTDIRESVDSSGFLLRKVKLLIEAFMESETEYTLSKLNSYHEKYGLTFQRWDIGLSSQLAPMDDTNNINELVDHTIKYLI